MKTIEHQKDRLDPFQIELETGRLGFQLLFGHWDMIGDLSVYRFLSATRTPRHEIR